MLFQLRTPRTRPWDSYMKKVIKLLRKRDETEHIAAFFEKAQEYRSQVTSPFPPRPTRHQRENKTQQNKKLTYARSQLVPILDDCAKSNHTRPEDLIKILDLYIPLLESLCDSLTKNVIDLSKCLEVVWTSALTFDVNFKSCSHSMNWERVNAYLVRTRVEQGAGAILR